MTEKVPSDQKSTDRCAARKQGEYNMLRCCLKQGHDGEHCYALVRTHAYCIPEKRR